MNDLKTGCEMEALMRTTSCCSSSRISSTHLQTHVPPRVREGAHHADVDYQLVVVRGDGEQAIQVVIVGGVQELDGALGSPACWW
jgi:hypothetical protein